MTDSSNMRHADLLIELGCEELPPKALDGIRDSFFRSVCDGLEKANVSFDREDSRSFSTPRRIALLLSGVAEGQPDQVIERRGPSVSAAFDADGKPTGAALGFARSTGKEVAELETMETDKGAWLYCRVQQSGSPLAELIYGILEQSVRQLPVPKPMRWADNDFSFVRPVHWLIVMHGEQVIEGELLGQSASNQTRGHRIHSPGPHVVPLPNDYEAILDDAYVVADHEKRKSRIQKSLLESNEQVIIDPSLLNEVNNLVEWPVAVACSFEEAFLQVPHAALIASMQDHQKFFPVADENSPGRVTSQFVAISNLESRDVTQVREGYERVIRPRLADARFFLEQDLKSSIESHLAQLDRVVFQQKIGTVGDKSRRMDNLSKELAELSDKDSKIAGRAALLSKCDLVTHMVGEFPELQGQMGEHYAASSGEDPDVARAIGEHYLPKFAGDDIPSSDAGQFVSIADRADTLVGIFAAGLKPTGNKDPFALRRAALGLLRILLEAELPLAPRDVFEIAAKGLSGQIEIESSLIDDVLGFVVERLRHFYTEKGFKTELVNAALASPWTTLPDLDARLHSIQSFMQDEAAGSLAASNKRIGNILRKSDLDISTEIDADLLNLSEESALFEEIKRIEELVDPLISEQKYEESLRVLAELKEPIDCFFDQVMVNDEDPRLRANRLALLALLKGQFDRISDLSILG